MDEQKPVIDSREVIRVRDTLNFLWESGQYLPFAFIRRSLSLMTVNDGTHGKLFEFPQRRVDREASGE